MKKIVIFFMLAGCELFNLDYKPETRNTPNTSNASESSKVQNPVPVVKSSKVQNLVPSQQDLNNLWIENLKSTDNYYADGSGGITAQANISEQGTFSTLNGRSSVKTFFLSKANSSTEAEYSYHHYYDNEVIFQANVLLKIVSQNNAIFPQVIRATYINNPNSINLDGFETDILYRNP